MVSLFGFGSSVTKLNGIFCHSLGILSVKLPLCWSLNILRPLASLTSLKITEASLPTAIMTDLAQAGKKAKWDSTYRISADYRAR